MIEQILLIAGASIFGLLGILHLVLIFFTNKFDAFDPQVTAAMKNTTPVLTKETSLWNAWVGFNASHGLGAIIVGAVYIPLSVQYFDIVTQSLWFSLLPVVFGLSYLFLARVYWFKGPFIGIAIATLCFIGAAVLINI